MNVFLTGGTGYIGSRLIPRLLARGHTVRALVRSGSESKLPSGCEPVIGDALIKASFSHLVHPSDTYVQLVGVAHPGPGKEQQFREIDLASGRASIDAAAENNIRHFIYVSVAHPAPTMHAYIAVRSECEALIQARGLNASILRPWYVLGPGHRWPLLLVPFYKFAEMLPQTRAGAQRLGLVTLEQMLATLVDAVEHPARGIVIAGVPEIRKKQTLPATAAARA